MKYRSLTKNGIRVSEIGLGLWPAGGSVLLADAPTGYGLVPESEVIRAIRAALELGVNFFDTADNYGLGRAERILGEALRERRGQVFVATKAGWVPDGAVKWMRDLSADHLRAAARRSCQRLQIDALDLFQLHAVPEPGEETEEVLDTLDELKTTGLTRLVGASIGFDVEAGLRLIRSARLDAIQVHFNLMQQNPYPELLDEAARCGVGIIASIPLAYGFLSGRYTRKSHFSADDWRSQLSEKEVASKIQRVADFRFLTQDRARTMAEAALQFVLAHPAVTTVIPGFRSEEQVRELVAAPDARPLSDIELARAHEVFASRRLEKV